MHPGEKVVNIRDYGYIRALTLALRSPSDQMDLSELSGVPKDLPLLGRTVCGGLSPGAPPPAVVGLPIGVAARHPAPARTTLKVVNG